MFGAIWGQSLPMPWTSLTSESWLLGWSKRIVLAEITSTLGLILVLFLFVLCVFLWGRGGKVLEYTSYDYKVIESYNLNIPS